MQKIDSLKLQALKIRHSIAIQEMADAIDKANDIKYQIWALEEERDKPE
jgi:hypothetical protein